MNPIKRFILFIIKDLKTDVLFLKEIFTGKYKPKYTLHEFLDFRETFKNKMLWLWLWIVLLAFAVGYLIAAKRYEGIANQFIIDTCMNTFNPAINPLNDVIMNFTTLNG